MSQTVDFIFDFGSPNAYFVHRVIPEIEARTGAKFAYKLCLLGGIFKTTGNTPPMMAFGGVKGKLAYEMLEVQRFIAKHGLTKFQFNSNFPIITTLMMRAAVALEMDGGDLPKFIEAGLVALWEDDHKMDDTDVFIRVMSEAGFDGAHLAARANDQDVKDQLRAHTDAAVERGVFGIPTFFVGNEMFFGKDRLGQVEEEIAKTSA